MASIFSGNPMLQLVAGFLFISNINPAQIVPGDNTYPVATTAAYLPGNFASGTKVNYLRTTLLLSPVTAESSIQPTNPDQTRITTKYLDGLGRMIQTVDHFQSPGRNDIVNTVKYDNLGRDAWHFLPYAKAEATVNDNGKFKLNAYSDQKDFYKTTLGYSADNFFYTQTNYEPSPLNRIVKNLPQGNSWVGSDRGLTVAENPLAVGVDVKTFTIGFSPVSLPVTSYSYTTGDLMVKTTTDEDGYFTEEYLNKNGLLVLKATGKTGNPTKLLTYYVYDDFKLLRFVISPKATVWLAGNNWTMTAAIANELCYRYTYDSRLRMVIKDVPGVGSQYMIYNKKDQMIFTQTATQRAKGQWLFNKYDILGRMIQTGVYNSTATQPGLQNLVDSSNAGGDVFLNYMFNDIYGNAAYASSFSNAKILTTNYYDDYSFTSRTYDASVMAGLPVGWNTTKSDETINMLTGTKVVVLDGAATPTELLTVNFYNDRGLLLQSQSQNHKGGWDTTTNGYDFIGQKLGTYTDINNPQALDNANIKTLESFYYDHAGRMLSDMHSLNGASNRPVIANSLDELGRLDNKNFSNGMVPTIKYEYNVRNWLTAINKAYCHAIENSNVHTFGMEISYNYGYGKKYFNGNVAGIKWRNSGNPQSLRSYGYSYDTYNRLTAGDFVYKTGQINSSGPWTIILQDFTASNMTYDENGNIKSMMQLGMNAANQKIVLDDLSYTYNPNSNKLKTVSESASSQSKNPSIYDNLGDFRDRNIGGVDYNYDVNGNMISDVNKDLSFTYDEIINKTKRVTKGTTKTVDYLYDAYGSKLQKKVSPTPASITDYVGTAVYINNKLSFINHPEGRIRYNASSPTPYMYDYFIKDNLGSTRSVITITEGPITGFAKSESAKSNEIKYVATSEPENASKENQLFDNIDNTRSSNLNRKSQNDNYVAKVYAKSEKTVLGPDITIKVMAGDSVKISAEALYIAEKNNPQEVVKNAINNFVTAFTAPMGRAVEGVNTIANGGLNNLSASILNIQNQNAKQGAPKAFLNYMLYDEHMNLVAEGSGAMQVKEKEGWQTLETERMALPQNGFLRVFSSNLEAVPVSINNTTLAVIPSKLVEEYNYYPYGLVFGQSVASGAIKKTDYLYNGKELQHDEFGAGNGLELTDYGARLYDQQIGRWIAPDPLAENNLTEAPYCYVGNSPIGRIDPDGKDWWDIVAGAAIGVATNIVPGSTSLRKNYNPNDAEDYNATLKTVDNTAAVAGAGAMILGADEMAAGGAAVAVGAGASSTGVGSTVGVPTMIGGGVVMVKGAITVGAGAMLMSNSAANKNAGYEYGKSNSNSNKSNNTNPSLSNTKSAVKEAQEKVGGSLPKGKPGKFGSPQRGDSKKGYRLDPGHPGKPQGDPEAGPHVNWWDYSKGKRDGSNSGAIPIKK